MSATTNFYDVRSPLQLFQRHELYAEVAELVVAVFPEVKEGVLGD